MIHQKIRVLVTGAGGGSIGMQVIEALKLAKTPYFIVATNSSENKTGLYEADKGYLVPPASSQNYLLRLLKICRWEKIQVLIPGSEQELMVISKNRDKFASEKILLLINSPAVIETCQDKIQTMEFLKKHHLLYPKFALWKGNRPPKDLNFPVVVKPSRGGGGSRFCFIARDQKELALFGRYLAKEHLVPIIQEYIGSHLQEYTVGVLTDFEGQLLGSIALKKEVAGNLTTALQIPDRQKKELLTISSGISQGFVDDYPRVRQAAEKIAHVLGSKGPLNIQCRKTLKGVYTMEINPRFSGTTSIRALTGFNEPDILIRGFLGEKIGKISYRKGLVLREFRMKYISFPEIARLKRKKFRSRGDK